LNNADLDPNEEIGMSVENKRKVSSSKPKKPN
jgi:hypothetical protein